MGTEVQYVIRLEEGAWGGVLLAITMAVHGVGMLSTLRVTGVLKRRWDTPPRVASSLTILIIASWLITLVHLVEVGVWAHFILWVHALPNISVAFYFTLMQYTTVGSSYNLPTSWRLLEGMISMAGVMTFAWSTGVLFSLAQQFQDQHLKR